jgi:hypothetical protein
MSTLTWTPWGYADDVNPILEGVVSVSTPSHGGLRVTIEVLERHLTPAQVKYCKALRYSSVGDVFGYFEEDCDMLIPLLVVPGVFEAMKRDEGMQVSRDELTAMFNQFHPNWPKE